MTRIITHQEETHYELAANSESLEFWKSYEAGIFLGSLPQFRRNRVFQERFQLHYLAF